MKFITVVVLIGFGLAQADFLSDLTKVREKLESKLTSFKDGALNSGSKAFDYLMNDTELALKKAEEFKPAILSPQIMFSNLTDAVDESLNRVTRDVNGTEGETSETGETNETATDLSSEIEEQPQTELPLESAVSEDGIIKITNEQPPPTMETVPEIIVTTSVPTPEPPMQNDQPAPEPVEPVPEVKLTTMEPRMEETPSTKLVNVMKITKTPPTPSDSSMDVSTTTVGGIKSGNMRPKDSDSGSNLIVSSVILLCLSLIIPEL